MENKVLLKVTDLHKTFTSKKDKTLIRALAGVSFSLNYGEILGIIGESGCGKSTLANVLVGLEKADSGKIEFQGNQLKKMLRKKVFREKCQMIFQNPFDTFDPRERIETILINTMKIHKVGHSKKYRVDICKKALEQYGLKPANDYMNRYTYELSGGQLQRIGILRSMILKPDLLIADEALSMLDVSVRADIINLLLDRVNKSNTAMIFISHDIATTSYISDSIAVMYFGKIVEIGTRDQIVDKAYHPYTRLLISSSGAVRSNNKVPYIVDCVQNSTQRANGCPFAPRCNFKEEKCNSVCPELQEVSPGHYSACFNIQSLY